MKTTILTLAFSFMLILPQHSQASNEACKNDTLKNDKSPAVNDGEIDLTLAENFLFQEKVYIHIYDQQDQPVISGEFSKKELNENKELKILLRKSTRFLQIDQHYYYFIRE